MASTQIDRFESANLIGREEWIERNLPSPHKRFYTLLRSPLDYRSRDHPSLTRFKFYEISCHATLHEHRRSKFSLYPGIITPRSTRTNLHFSRGPAAFVYRVSMALRPALSRLASSLHRVSVIWKQCMLEILYSFTETAG